MTCWRPLSKSKREKHADLRVTLKAIILLWGFVPTLAGLKALWFGLYWFSPRTPNMMLQCWRTETHKAHLEATERSNFTGNCGKYNTDWTWASRLRRLQVTRSLLPSKFGTFVLIAAPRWSGSNESQRPRPLPLGRNRFHPCFCPCQRVAADLELKLLSISGRSPAVLLQEVDPAGNLVKKFRFSCKK